MRTNHLGNNNPVLYIVCTSQWGAFAKICLVYEWLKGITEISDGYTYNAQVMNIILEDYKQLYKSVVKRFYRVSLFTTSE